MKSLWWIVGTVGIVVVAFVLWQLEVAWVPMILQRVLRP